MSLIAEIEKTMLFAAIKRMADELDATNARLEEALAKLSVVNGVADPQPMIAKGSPEKVPADSKEEVKEPQTTAFISWHQDLTYWGYDDASEVTAWVALSPATSESGCMRFVPGSHRTLVEHRDTFDESNMLSRGQEVAVEVDEADAVEAALRPGEMSLHHGHLFHASNRNTSTDRRIGLALRFVTPAMKQVSGRKTFAHLVAGEDRYGHFELLPRATEVMAAGDVANARRAIAVQDEIGYADVPDPDKRPS